MGKQPLNICGYARAAAYTSSARAVNGFSMIGGENGASLIASTPSNCDKKPSWAASENERLESVRRL
jgi:hypothetical protein